MFTADNLYLEADNHLILDNTVDQATAAKNLEVFKLSWNSNTNFQIEVKRFLSKAKELGQHLFSICDTVNDNQIISLVVNKPWGGINQINLSHTSNFIASGREDANRALSQKNKVNNLKI